LRLVLTNATTLLPSHDVPVSIFFPSLKNLGGQVATL
jgi:hypothetical protein